MIVLGLGFGDEGKGLTTSFLTSQVKNPLVVRFSGGHQAGHTVVYSGKKHVFSSFGSGTLQGAPTYWSQHCTFYPLSFLQEHKLLDNPLIFVHPLCPVTTPYDVTYNKTHNSYVENGTVGIGFGATLQRQEDNYKLFVQDLFFETVLRQKLHLISDYYADKSGVYNDMHKTKEIIENFISNCREVVKLIHIMDNNILAAYNPIYEGSQGIMLDKSFGFFPNVTRSNTTSKNAILMSGIAQDIYYVTRSYLTRHGNGYMPSTSPPVLKNNEDETNVKHQWQGEFRTAYLNYDLLNYALQCDDNFSEGLTKNLVITCMDQYEIDVDLLLSQLHTNFNKIYLSYGPSLTNLKLYK